VKWKEVTFDQCQYHGTCSVIGPTIMHSLKHKFSNSRCDGDHYDDDYYYDGI